MLDEALEGDTLVHYKFSLHWPRIPKPPEHLWTLWKRQLRLQFLTDGKSTTLRKQYRLGK
jgi:hypothetical protein